MVTFAIICVGIVGLLLMCVGDNNTDRKVYEHLTESGDEFVRSVTPE